MSHPLFNLLQRLDEAGYHYILERHRPECITVTVTFVGERTEVDVFEDGHMEVARFPGTEDIVGGEEAILNLIEANQKKDS